MNKIIWQNPNPPTPNVSYYDHMIGSFNERIIFKIEWKSWKENDGRAIYAKIKIDDVSYTEEYYIGTAIKDTNESAQEFCEKWLDNFISSLVLSKG